MECLTRRDLYCYLTFPPLDEETEVHSGDLTRPRTHCQEFIPCGAGFSKGFILGTYKSSEVILAGGLQNTC